MNGRLLARDKSLGDGRHHPLDLVTAPSRRQRRGAGPQGAVVQLVLPQSRVVRANPFNSGLTPAYDPATRS